MDRSDQGWAEHELYFGCDGEKSGNCVVSLIDFVSSCYQGPSETPYEGGVFQLAFSVPEQYPLQPPQVRFLTKIFHPNVHFKV